MILITSHQNLDFDGLASMVAASKMYRNTVLYMPWSFSKTVKRFYTFFKHKFSIKKDRDIDFSQAAKVIIVDGMMKAVSPKLKNIIEKKKVYVRQYNHHYMENILNSSNINTINI